MLRVRDEARWIGRVLASMAPVCDRIVVFDDHSQDETPAICAAAGAVVIPSEFADLNETADKNVLLSRVAEESPDWVLHVDGDEELTPASARIIPGLCHVSYADVFRFRILYLWDRPDQIRVDGIYGQFRRSRLFRFVPGAKFITTGNGGNFHCGNAPAGGKIAECDAEILHYGYMERVDRVRKFAWYNQQDPDNANEDRYRHMAIGDLFPNDSKFLHGGPLSLEPLSI